MNSASHIKHHSRRRISLRNSVALVGVLLLGMLSQSVVAQDTKMTETVLERSRPDLDARGLRLGAFKLLPKLGLGLLSDSNIFATDAIEIDDLIVLIEPEVILKSDWSRHELELGFDWVAARYSDFGTEDYDDWRIWGDGRIDIGRGALTGFARHADLHEWRTSPDNRRGIVPTLFTLDELRVGYRQPFGQFIGSIEAQQRQLEYEDTITFFGSLSNADRDRQRSDFKIRVGHQTMPTLQPFLQLSATAVDYDQRFDRFGFERSSTGFDLVGGTAIDLSGQTFGEVYLGYISREYDDPRFTTADGPIFGGEITWNVTSLTTLVFSADRRIDGTTIVGSSGIINTGFGVEANHELRRNLIISLEFATNNEDFQDIERDDDILRAGIEGIYMMNRYLHFRLSYLYQNRDTSPENSGGFEYVISRFFLGVEAQL